MLFIHNISSLRNEKHSQRNVGFLGFRKCIYHLPQDVWGFISWRTFQNKPLSCLCPSVGGWESRGLVCIRPLGGRRDIHLQYHGRGVVSRRDFERDVCSHSDLHEHSLEQVRDVQQETFNKPEFIRRLTLNPWVFNPFDGESRERFVSSINPFQLPVRV